MLNNLIFNLLVVHILCDFYLQTNSSCANKVSHSANGYALWLHTIIIGLLSFIAVWDIKAWWIVLLIMLSYLIIDWLKSALQIKYDIYKLDCSEGLKKGSNNRYNLYFFVADQFMHILVIVGIACYWYNMNREWSQFQWLQTAIYSHPIWVYTSVAFLLILRPVNILILQMLESCKLGDDDCSDNQGYFHAGALIGYTERSLILIFVILSQYEAIGFLIAAKSILRFSEASSGNVKSEYVLSGTLLSLLFSLLIGLCVVKMPII